ncbi:hypothetical protein [Candidatus Pristimantibacillus sp. PTI5]|uniref:hypothetical protein n=1 Tax=Candidatus Pristimantibacillus sp. PTI5 TaxID=3400422 RepID=UPI003B02D5EB
MNKTKKNSSLTKLIFIALMSVTVVFTASACNNDNNVDNANGNVIIEDDNNASGNTTAPEATAEPEATDEVSTP